MSTSGEAGAAGPPLLTLKEAAALLGVTEPAVIQMLKKERLDGPVFEGRAPNGAGRVTRASADALLASRAGEPRRGPAAQGRAEPLLAAHEGEPRRDPTRHGRAEPPGRPFSFEVSADLRARVRELESEVRRARQAERAAREALLAMKTTADQALDTARTERKLSRSLTAEVARLTDVLGQAHEQTERVDAAAQGYSATLTGLLVPPDASELDGP